MFDLGTFTSVPLMTEWLDANGNTVTPKTDFAVDDATQGQVADNGDGTAVFTRVVTTAGKVTVFARATNADGSTVDATLEIDFADQSVTSPNAVSGTITAGEPS